MEYKHQLWSPYKTMDIVSVEGPQRTFTSKIQDVQHLKYWEILQHLKLCSMQRKGKRYIVIHVWKVFEGHMLNMSIQANYGIRRGRFCNVKSISGTAQKIRTIKYNTFTHNGARLFTYVPQKLRDITGVPVESFMRELDKWLASLPGQPPTPCRPRSRIPILDLDAGYSHSHHNTLPEVTRKRREEERPGAGGCRHQPGH
ncbi:hypothetical protein Pmani_029897 [Petrolisthes manimaculis]|uniref:Uncharacterized protein n=1 Tax=Petrolisthes manimaculis TaxID=1843537 RepID=A0AAE1TU18_9EUCA|nr:hypothetical protein Pmani_029897 [Petrolisthes manimaculis]